MKKLLISLILIFWCCIGYADVKLTGLTEDTSPTGDDLTLTTNDPAGTPASRKVTLTNLKVGALLANGANCSAGNYPLGVDAAGAVESCTAASPTTVDYLVGTADGTLSGEIAVGTTPGGELGNTWASPTLDDSVTTTGWVMGTFSATQLTSPTLLTDLIDGVGAVDIDLGSADITDFTVVTDGGTVIIDGNITQDAGTTLFMGGLLDATGAVDMDYGSADITDHTFTTDGTGTAEIVLPAGSIDSTEILDTTIALTDTAITAGRSLTISTNDILADAELYTDTKCIWWENPVAGDDFKSVWIADNYAVTVTRLWCESDQTVNTMLQVDDGTPADMDTVDLACVSTPDTDTSLDGDATIASGDRVDVDVASVSGTPTWVSICFTFTRDD